MPFCSNCGNEVKDNTKFCPNCGNAMNKESEPTSTPQNNNSGINCPKCGSIIPFGNTVCLNCGTPLNQESNTVTIILGYIGTILGSLFIPLLGIIIGIISAIYLLTRPSKSAKIHGIIMIIILAIVVILWFSYMSYVNSMRSYYYYWGITCQNIVINAVKN